MHIIILVIAKIAFQIIITINTSALGFIERFSTNEKISFSNNNQAIGRMHTQHTHEINRAKLRSIENVAGLF